MTGFGARVKRNRKLAVVAMVVAITGFSIVAYIVIWFVVFVAIPLSVQGQQIVGVLVAFLGMIGFWAGWSAKATLIENVDTMLDRMGPLQRRVLKAAIDEEEKKEAVNGGR
jgi:hypothetical protein